MVLVPSESQGKDWKLSKPFHGPYVEGCNLCYQCGGVSSGMEMMLGARELLRLVIRRNIDIR